MLKKSSLLYMCMVQQFERCQIGGYFLDDMADMHLNEAQNTHVLTEELRPWSVRETTDYIRLQLEYLHLQLISVITQGTLK